MLLLEYIRKHLPKIFLLFFLILYFIILAKPISLTNTDIGRHLINGQEIVEGNLDVLFRNYYSTTMSDQKFINHHWLTGVVFHTVYSWFGFTGLHIFHTLILLAAGALFYSLMVKHSSWKTAGLLSLPALLFLSTRTEIRPETFGFLFLLIELNWVKKILSKSKQSKLKSLPKYSWVLIPLLHLLWVNLHISFIFSLFIVGLLALVFHYQADSTIKIKKQTKILFLSLIPISLLNPNGLMGTLAPLSIFKDYGYRVFENQTMWFLRSYYPGPIIPLYFLMGVLIALALWLSPPKTNMFDKTLAVIGIILGFMALRNIPIFLIFSFPLLARVSYHYTKPWIKNIEFEHPNLSYGLLTLTIYALFFFYLRSSSFMGKLNSPLISLGLREGQAKTIKAIKEFSNNKPFFNNYDIGSAIIFALNSNPKVFVDNRPEAYSSEFFHDTYIPMQENTKIWQEQSELHNFQFIIFGHRDITPWARTFFKERLRDSDWAVVYLDETLIIFAERNQNNQKLIEEKSIQVPLSRLGI